jgi:glycosyltransferase involved in cell wall biosynthesis
MIKAFSACSDEDARLLIAGRPIDASTGRSVASAMQGDERITLIAGHVEDDMVELYMNACDVVVLPFRRIFTSGSAILAMSFGKPCIAPRVGCIPDALDDEGAFLYDGAAPNALETTMRAALASRTRLTEMGLHNAEKVTAWDWKRVARMTAAVYESLRVRELSEKPVIQNREVRGERS